ncbi:hypothetical protein KIW84_020016 [Lathyrus oleraceus]|uniref:Uncharacterized protein n=1 Tax=Pisum sativum TaxID=3888 RepID=A0A9D4Y4K5_PEA|nr:hypothetical protein KIW84_020016 [Pisum sativum]
MLKLVLNCRLGERGMHVEELERELKLLLDRIKLSVKALEDEGMIFSILPQIMLRSALSIMLWSGLGGSDLGGSGSTYLDGTAAHQLTSKPNDSVVLLMTQMQLVQRIQSLLTDRTSLVTEERNMCKAGIKYLLQETKNMEGENQRLTSQITPIIEDICVYGNNFKSILVLVVVPNEEVVNKWAYANGHIASSPIFVLLTS